LPAGETALQSPAHLLESLRVLAEVRRCLRRVGSAEGTGECALGRVAQAIVKVARPDDSILVRIDATGARRDHQPASQGIANVAAARLALALRRDQQMIVELEVRELVIRGQG